MKYDVRYYPSDNEELQIATGVECSDGDIQALIAAVIDYYDVHSVDTIFAAINAGTFRVFRNGENYCSFYTKQSNPSSIESAWRGVIAEFLDNNPNYSFEVAPIQEDELFALLNC